MEKNNIITKRHYSKRILPVPCPFVTSRFHKTAVGLLCAVPLTLDKGVFINFWHLSNNFPVSVNWPWPIKMQEARKTELRITVAEGQTQNLTTPILTVLALWSVSSNKCHQKVIKKMPNFIKWQQHSTVKSRLLIMDSIPRAGRQKFIP